MEINYTALLLILPPLPVGSTETLAYGSPNTYAYGLLLYTDVCETFHLLQA